MSILALLLVVMHVSFINSAEQSPTPSHTNHPLGMALCIDTLVGKLNEDFSLPKPPAIGHTPCLSSASSVTIGLPTPTDLMSPGSKLTVKFSPFFSPSTQEASSFKAAGTFISSRSKKRNRTELPTLSIPEAAASSSFEIKPKFSNKKDVITIDMIDWFNNEHEQTLDPEEAQISTAIFNKRLNFVDAKVAIDLHDSIVELGKTTQQCNASCYEKKLQKINATYDKMDRNMIHSTNPYYKPQTKNLDSFPKLDVDLTSAAYTRNVGYILLNKATNQAILKKTQNKVFWEKVLNARQLSKAKINSL
jgi:hypothetical protein